MIREANGVTSKRSSGGKREQGLVSIGLPVFNGARFLPDALRSVLEQTVEHWELVISDNASTDATPDICEEFARCEPRIRLVRNKENVGAAANFQQVLRLARGEYFKWLAADDVIAPRFLERCLEALGDAPRAVVAYTDANLIDPAGGEVAPVNFHNLRLDRPAASDRFRSYLAAMATDGQAVVPLVMGLFRRDELRRVRPMPTYYGADFVLMAAAILRGPGVHVGERLASFRQHEASSSWGDKPRASVQERFYAARSRSRWQGEWRLRKRYVELARLAWTADIPVRDRAAVVEASFRYTFARSLAKLRIVPARARQMVAGA